MLSYCKYSQIVHQIKMLQKLSSTSHIQQRGLSQVLLRIRQQNALSNPCICNFHKGGHLLKKEVYKDESDKPTFKYSAFTESPGMSRTMDTIDPPINQDETCPYRRISVLLSFGVFAWYWFYFREEHHIDKMIDGDVYDQMPKMELVHLEGVRNAMKRARVDTLEVDVRIKYLEQEEARKAAELEAIKAGKELPKALPEIERLKTSIERMKKEGADTTAAEERLRVLMKREAKVKDSG